MEFTVEDVSPVKKKIAITVAPEEVNAAIAAAVAIYKGQIKMDGFRKGKVPASVVEKRFHDTIYKEAREDLINAHINEILKDLDVQPVGGLDISGDDRPLERGKAYDYTMEFEVLPKFDLPPYDGLEVEEEKANVDDTAVARIIDRLRQNAGKLVAVSGNAPAKDGQIANIDFEGFEDGKPIAGLKHVNYDLPIGEQEALPDFVKLVKGIPVGHTGEGQITFPSDFIDPSLAGKTITMKVTVHAVKERELPALDDDFAKRMGKDTVEELEKGIREDAIKNFQNLNKGVAQKKLLDGMLKLVDFELPQSTINMQMRLLLTDLAARLEKQGKSIGSLGKSMDELVAELRPQAEEMARTQILLQAIAKKEGLEVTDSELNQHIILNSLRTGKDYHTTRGEMEKNGMIFQLRDKILEDKAMDLVYARAKVEMVDAKPDAKPDEGPSDKTSAGGDKAPDSQNNAGSGEDKNTEKENSAQ